MPTSMCQYGNCTETDCPITITNRKTGYRKTFCSEEHAALWLAKQVSRHQAMMKLSRDESRVG
jgi:hypothetical protein